MEYVKAFLVGGAFCLIGQILIDKTKWTSARILVLYVVTGTILGALEIYAPIKEFAGCGATVPIIGFGANLSKGIAEAVAEEGLFGLLTGPMKAAAGGIGFVVLAAFFAALVFQPKGKS